MSQLCMNDGIYDERALDACISWDASTIEIFLLFSSTVVSVYPFSFFVSSFFFRRKSTCTFGTIIRLFSLYHICIEKIVYAPTKDLRLKRQMKCSNKLARCSSLSVVG